MNLFNRKRKNKTVEVAKKSSYCVRCNNVFEVYKNKPGGEIVCERCFYDYMRDLYLTGIVPEIKKSKNSGYPRYSFYKKKLGWAEEIRESQSKKGILEVRCRYCNRWFIPTLKCTQERTNNLNNAEGNQYYFYCSASCKKLCPIYGKRTQYKGKEGNNSREVPATLRQMVFERDDWKCQRCFSDKSLECHHIIPIKKSPILQADIDNCVTLCTKCHKKAHSEIGCRYADLANCV